ncbi:hypothetical protein V5F49_20555 [Xanthobacter sp. V3C-3]|uniref:phage baseplate protein n=1 Tax=Xanthobacter lutulentifluminis TaxID=3119935 RepID=UPI003727E2A3
MVDIVEAVTGTVSQILVGSGRSIGGIRPQVVVEETARDSLFITNHPVEKGAAISDHAFKLPAECEMRCAWSDSGNYQGYSRAIYSALQSLQSKRQPFTVTTGKRTYRNMLIAGIEITTSAATEYALFVRVLLREVIIVSTSTVSTGSSAGTRADPARTGGTTDGGQRQPVPKNLETGYAPGPTVA